MKESVLYISYDGMTDPLGQSQVIPYLKKLSELGFQFSVVSCEKEDKFEELGGKIRYALEDVKIDWYPVMYKKSPPGVSTLLNIRNLKKIVTKLFQKKEFSIIHCRSYLPAIIGLAMKRKFQVPIIFDMRGFWVDERVEGGLWNTKNPVYKFAFNYFKTLESELVKEADAIISLTQAGKEEVQKWPSWKETKVGITVIPCSCDFDFYKKPAEEELLHVRKELGINPDDFVLTYVGSIGTWYLLDEMLEFYRVLLNVIPNAFFLLFSPVSDKFIEEKCFEHGIPVNRVKAMFVSKKDYPRYVGVSDFGLFFIKPCFSKIASSPTKLGELLSMEIPVVTNSGVGDVKKIIKETNGGIVISELNKNEYLSVAKQIDSRFFKPDVAKARQIFDLNIAVEKYLKVYQQMLEKRK
ncbi:glycosyltransferase [Cytophagaceae bacterium ABcell3]|nr:glycosyltransferase [Cytophagaceae bacterium ABcell3]